MSVLPWKRPKPAAAPIAAPEVEPDARDIAIRCAAAKDGRSVQDLPKGVRFDAEGLTFEGVTFTREVQLCSLRLQFAVNFIRCTFQSTFDARWLQADALCLKDSHLFAPFKGVSLTLDGHLDLEGATSEVWIDISVAEVGGDVKFARATISYSNVEGEHPTAHPRFGAAIFAGGLQAHSFLMDELTCHGRVFLDAGRFSGILKATGAKIESYYAHRAGTGLHRNGKANSATVAENQWDHLSISATDCTFTGAVILGREARGQAPSDGRHAFVAYGQINLSNAQLMGDLVCTGAKLHSAYWSATRKVIGEVLKQDDLPLAALHASRALVDGAVFLDGDFEAKGEVRLNSIDVRGIVRCEHSQIDGRLPHGSYGPQPLSDGAPLIAKAVSLVRAQIGNDLLLGPRFSAQGSVNLRNATVRGDLNCCGSRFVGWRTSNATTDDEQPETLAASGAEIQGDLLLGTTLGGASAADSPCMSFGQIRLRGTKVRGNFHLECATLDLCENADGGAAKKDTKQLPFVAKFESLNVAGATFLANSESRERKPKNDADKIKHVVFKGCATFEGMTTTVWEDAEDAWPQSDPMLLGRAFFELNGLTYERLSGPLSGHKRLIWLLHQQDRDLIRPRRRWFERRLKADQRALENTRDWGFKTQPWEQCAGVLYQMGYRRDARFLYRQQQRFIRVHSGLLWIERIYNAFLGLLVGHGYRPYYALFWAVSLWLLGWAIFEYGYRYGEIVEKKNEAVTAQTPDMEPFNPALYSLDVLLPAIPLGEQERWILVDHAPAAQSAHTRTLSLGSKLNVLEDVVRPVVTKEWLIPAAVALFFLVSSLLFFFIFRNEIFPRFGAGSERGNRRTWQRLYRQALALRSDAGPNATARRKKLQATLGTAVTFSAFFVGLFLLIMGAWLVDQSVFDFGARWFDKPLFHDLFQITLARFWLTWQTLWGWLLISALVVGVGGTIFRPRDLVR